jgi:hypothetical protein
MEGEKASNREGKKPGNPGMSEVAPAFALMGFRIVDVLGFASLTFQRRSVD